MYPVTGSGRALPGCATSADPGTDAWAAAAPLTAETDAAAVVVVAGPAKTNNSYIFKKFLAYLLIISIFNTNKETICYVGNWQIALY